MTRSDRPSAPLYLLSALLVLAGGYLSLHEGGRPLTVDLHRICGSQGAYAACLFVVLATLHRRWGEIRVPALLAGLLSLFLVDALLTQHLYGWTTRDGRLAGMLGAAGALLLLGGTAWALRLRLTSRPVTSLAACIAFARFAPALLDGAGPGELPPRHVALGWLLAACLLPAILAPPVRPRDGAPPLPWRALDLGGVAVGVLGALLHFVPAGLSYDLPFRAPLLAPFVILAAPALRRTCPGLAAGDAGRRLLALLPWTGLLLSAASIVPGMLETPWARDWPLAPFTLALALLVIVQSAEAIALRDVARAHAAAAAACLGCLGGDLPSILERSVEASPLQAAAVVAIAASMLAIFRRPAPGIVLHALASFVAAGALAEFGLPRIPAWISLAAWAPLLLLAPAEPSRAARIALAACSCAVPVALLLASPTDLPRAVFAAASCVAGGVAALLRREVVLGSVAAISGVVAAVGWPLSFQAHGEIRPGTLLVEAGFAVLLAAYALSLLRHRRGAKP